MVGGNGRSCALAGVPGGLPLSLRPERMLRPAGGERRHVARPPLLLPVRMLRPGSPSARTLFALGPGGDPAIARLPVVVKRPSRAASLASTLGWTTAGRMPRISRESNEHH